MFRILFALHLIFAIFTVGPLVHAVTTATRGLRQADAHATAYAARMARIYSGASVLVIIFGVGVATSKDGGKRVAQFSDTWIWLSALLWVLAGALTSAVIAPTLDQATRQIGEQKSVAPLTTRVAVSGAGVAAIFVTIVFLMVYKPGS
ncbi:MAG: hypothetical protein M3N95_00185 [Actinomycetota bacterium]|nr:hypothetical protein [Actinomycetota bacterium]